MSSTPQRSAIIIGAGPAGSVAGILLARRGWEVTLVEQHRFPRDKVCGECLSWLAVDVLKRLKLRQALPHVILNRAIFVACDGCEATVTLPREMWALSRKRLDDVLLSEARDAGAIVLQPHRCEGIDAARVTTRDLHSNIVSTHEADVVLRADGKALKHTEDLGVKAHFENVGASRETISLFGLRGHYVGLAPIEDGRWNLAMSVPAKIVRRHSGNLDSLFNAILEQNSGLRLRFRSAQRTGPWLASPLPRFAVEQNWPEKVIPLGNAAAALEPIGGEGMGLAMRSAELAAIALDQNLSIEDLRASFRRMWSIRRGGCRTAALALSSPRIASVIVRMVRGVSHVFPTSAGCGDFSDDAIPCSRS